MEEAVLEILTRYLSPQAARNLLLKAAKGPLPSSPWEWARFLEGPLWQELKALLPFREMPRELKRLIGELKALAPQVAEEEAEEEEEANLPPEVVDLENPEARHALARRLARLEGVLGVVVVGQRGREELLAGEAPPFEAVHFLLGRQGYRAFYALLPQGLVALRPLEGGYVGVMARKEANIGRLLHALRRITTPTEVGG
ncbi:hypothetical protein YIM1640_16310 [Thermus oshimai]|jgi:hypothetical protein|uniref:Uncharacterized protein n=2 Tax=Thermus oshimai TaxID=56957 RepID=K7R362_THEOS|nr:hypothetical protein Theos_0217 [Thermus oshimai JL-2]